MSKVQDMIDMLQKDMDEKLATGKITQEKLDELHKETDFTFQDYVLFQEKKSIASQYSGVALDEMMVVYGYLGNTVEQFNKQPLAVKVVLSKIFLMLLDPKAQI